MFWAEIWINIRVFYLKIFSFWRWNFLYIWIGVFSKWYNAFENSPYVSTQNDHWFCCTWVVPFAILQQHTTLNDAISTTNLNTTRFQCCVCRPRWLSWMCRPTRDQEVAGSIPAEVGNILSWRLIMKYFLRSFSPFRWFKKGSCQFLAKECAQYWLTA